MAKFLDPNKIFEEIGLLPGMVIADFGAGSGFFSIAAAKKAGQAGKVYAIDIQETALEALRSRANFYNLANVETVRSDLEKADGSKLKDSSCDLVLISNILFQVENPKTLLSEAARVLKPKGLLALVEWIPEKMPTTQGVYPVEKDEAKKLIGGAGFEILKELQAGEYHYGFLARKTS